MGKFAKLIALLMVPALLLCACSRTSDPMSETDAPANRENTITTLPVSESADPTTPAAIPRTSEYFSNRDFETEYDKSRSAVITLNGDTAACSSDAVQISGSTVTITDEGTYILSGTLDNGMIIVDSEKGDKTQLVLNGVSINSEASAPIYILQSDKVFITLADGTQNTLSNGGSFTAIDENNIDSVIFSKEDLTLNGSGSLTVTSPAGHGIVSKDELTVTGGTYAITSASHGITGKDNVCIAGGDITITAGKDGIRADNDEDTALGFLYIRDGSFAITAAGDGISASGYMQLDGGDYTITTGGGSANAAIHTSENWGGFMGGDSMGGGHGGMGGGGRGGMGDPMGGMESMTDTSTEEDNTSIKGIKASADLTVNGGSYTIDSADDAIHSNASVTVNGGTFAISSGDDGFHADETLTIVSGTVNISESYEGLEGLHVVVSGGDITLNAIDDGLNAAGGTDSSGFGGMRGGDMFGGGMGGGMGNPMGGMGDPMDGGSSGSIVISGGTLYVKASGDGIDANGTLEISGGYAVVCGPTQGDTATLDYDFSGVISGGTFIGTGSSMMAQTFSDSSQGVLAVSVGNQPAGTAITLTDASGNTILSHAPELDFAVVILSSPDMIKGENYTITVGSASAEFAAS